MEDDDELNHPLDLNQARKLISYILAKGTIEFWDHCKDELANDGLETTDAVNVLRGGMLYEAPEFNAKDQTWRYRVHTKIMCVVVTFYSGNELGAVTAWRKK